MFRLINTVCLLAVFALALQNRAEFWVMDTSRCESMPIEEGQCGASSGGCGAEVEACGELSCEADIGLSRTDSPECRAADAVPPCGDLSCLPEQKQQCCLLIHPLWADLPHKLELSLHQTDLSPAFNRIDLKLPEIHPHTFIDQGPRGINPVIKTTVLRI